MVRIVHTGDMHFDSPFAALPYTVAQRRKEEQKETFLRIIESAHEYGADALLIAGDMFDSRFVTSGTIAFLKDCFSRIKNIAVFVAPGNHDYLTANSPYRTVDFGENVHVFGGEPEAIEVGEAVIYGCGFADRFIRSSLLSSDFRHTGDKVGILLMHGDIGQESDYNPIKESVLAQTGLAYAALGHVHAYSGIHWAGTTQYAYCGIPEGRHFDEEGQCGFIRGEFSGKEAKLSFIPVAKRKNVSLEITVSELSGTESILRKIREQLQKENLYKISLCGEIKNTVYIDTDFLQKELSGDCFYIKLLDKTKSVQDGTEESFLEKIFIERLSGRTDTVGRMALRYGLEALRRQKR